MPYDARAIANFVLDLADQKQREITNLSLNKIVYFLHSNFLVKFDKPLTSAKIEAWKFGPVYREIYSAFKKFQEKSITCRATRVDPASGVVEICSADLSAPESEFLVATALRYIQMETHRLVSLSHAPGGPWDQVWNHRTLSNASMRITDELIQTCHRKAARH